MELVSQRLPHRFPFQLIDRREGDLAVLALTAGAVWSRDSGRYPDALLVEIMAQASMVLLEDPAGQPGGRSDRAFLAGVEDLVVADEARIGDVLQARAEVQARFGGTIKVAVRLGCEEREIARASLLLVLAP